MISQLAACQEITDSLLIGDWIESDLRPAQNTSKTTDCNIIRVVFHVITDPSHPFANAEISEAQVRSQVRAANMFFRNDSLNYHEDNNGLGYTVKLAELDPDGNTTNGINYYDGIELFGDDYGQHGLNSNSSSGISPVTMANALAWGADADGKKYLNCYVVNRIDGTNGGGVQAYAYFPTNNVVYGNYNLYNTIGHHDLEGEGEHFILKTYTNEGKVWAHELLHNFAIFHTFQGQSCTETNCATQGDRVCDTEPQTQPSGNTNSCGTVSHNLMDYLSEWNKHIITEGQAERANLAIQNSLEDYLVCTDCSTSPDLNSDGFVNVQDVSLMNSSFGCSIGDLCYNPAHDLNCDGFINILDISLLSAGFDGSVSTTHIRPLGIITQKVYDIRGRLVGESLDDLPDGFYVIRYSDGTVKKVCNGI